MPADQSEDARAIGAVFIRNLIRQKGSGAERALLAELTPEETESYQTAIANSWVTIHFLNKLYKHAALTLYPGDSAGLQKLGEAMARNHLTGVYRIFVSVATTSFLIQQTCKLWKCCFRRGKVGTEWKEDDHFGKMVVKDYPELPDEFRELLSGYIAGALQVVGNQDVKVIRNDEDPQAWKWIASWK